MRTRLLIGIISLVVLLDEVLKWVLLRAGLPYDTASFEAPIAIAIHKNFGLAFDVPVPIPAVIGFSVLIGGFLAYVAKSYWHSDRPLALGAVMILLGGAGNLFDRVIYGFTVDYLILFGRSAINLSDAVILSGIVWMLRRRQFSTNAR